jgi:transmembrane sensor
MSKTKGLNKQRTNAAQAQATEWFVRMSGRTSTEQEREDFERWLSEDPLNYKEYQAVQDLWHELDGLKATASTNNARNLTHSTASRVWHRLALAASIVIVMVTAHYLYQYNPVSYETAIGTQQRIHLSDESVVHLNSNSLLQVNLTEEQRTLHLLRGEAYFTVAPDPARPFVVISAGSESRAIGTQFNVYSQSAEVQITVVEGRVEVSTEGGEKQLLTAGQMVSYENDGDTLSFSDHHNAHTLDWLAGRIYFQDTPLVDVVAQLNRYLVVPLHISDPKLNTLELSGTFRIANLNSFPELLPQLLPVSLENTADSLLLRRSDNIINPAPY